MSAEKYCTWTARLRLAVGSHPPVELHSGLSMAQLNVIHHFALNELDLGLRSTHGRERIWQI